MAKLLVAATILLGVWCECDYNLLPMPHECTVSEDKSEASTFVIKDPCSIMFKIGNISVDGRRHVN